MRLDLKQILISSSQPDFRKELVGLHLDIVRASMFQPGDERLEQLRAIFRDVVKRRDEALCDLTEKFDGVRLAPDQFRICAEDLEKAHKEVEKNNPRLLATIRQAIKNVRKYQEEIFIADKLRHPGIRYTPIKRVGICVPGASAPLPSTVIMTAVPAQVAGVKEIVVVSPPRYNGSIHPVILAVCHELGIGQVYRVGGAQAVAALTFSTESVRNVDKIVGPGSLWVQMAKRSVFGRVGIDAIAGPSEVLIVANDQANPVWVAADMLSQAEHDPGSAILFTDSSALAKQVLEELEEQVVQLERSEGTIKCLKKYSKIAVFDGMDRIIEWTNKFAAEHLEIQCGDESRKIAELVQNAGAIFIGDYSPVAVGDYWAGPSHTLPTGTSARFSSALSANDFIKSTSIIEYDRKRLAESAEDIIRLAEVEGLDAHARSVRIRQPK